MENFEKTIENYNPKGMINPFRKPLIEFANGKSLELFEDLESDDHVQIFVRTGENRAGFVLINNEHSKVFLLQTPLQAILMKDWIKSHTK